MFTRLTILLFVFFAVAGLVHVAAPGASSVTRETSAKGAAALARTGSTIDGIIADSAKPQP